MKYTDEQLALAIYTANNWSSDQAGNGLALLSLGTTRTIHGEQHRGECLAEIEDNLAYSRGLKEPTEPNDPKRDIPRLEMLREVVKGAKVKEEIIPYKVYFDITERLYRAGTL